VFYFASELYVGWAMYRSKPIEKLGLKMALVKAETFFETSCDQPTQLYFIGNALCVPNHSFLLQVYTGLELIGNAVSFPIFVGSEITNCYNKIVRQTAFEQDQDGTAVTCSACCSKAVYKPV
jgi:DNA-directed RNA polymerase subunit RPC12/RpoP